MRGALAVNKLQVTVFGPMRFIPTIHIIQSMLPISPLDDVHYHSPHLPVTPVQLMRPDIDRNASCTVNMTLLDS